MHLRGFFDLVKEAGPASASVAATGISGALAAAPPWLIAVGQAVIVVVFTAKAIEKRLEKYQSKVDRLAGRVEVLHGRVDELDCIACERKGA